MTQKLPSLPIKKFTPEIFANIIAVYAKVAGIRNPCNHRIDPVHEFKDVLNELSDGHSYSEWRFGSTLGQHSKLFLHSVRKNKEVHIAFDFDPNTPNDWRIEAVMMRKRFLEATGNYLASVN